MSVSVLEPPARVRAPWWLGPLVAFITVLFTFTVLEVVVRVARIWVVPDYATAWYRPTALDGVPYGLKPNLDVAWGRGAVRTNADGLRDDRVFGARDPQTKRILAVGDSVTFGFGVDQADSFPARLERALNTPGTTPVEVVNAGVSGYSLRDTARLLPTLVERYHPDAIVWTLVPNDYDDSFAVGPDGLVVRPVDDNSFASTSEFALGQDATKPVDFDDYRRSMTDASRHWAEGTRMPAARVTPWLERSYLFRWVRSLVNGLPIASSANAPAAAQPRRQNVWTDPAGRVHPFPAHVALFSHRSRVATFNRYLDEARALATSRQVPLIIVNTNLPIESRHRQAVAGYAYYEASVLLDQPFVEFHSQNSLRWDPHFSPDGNERFAHALLPALACAGVPGAADGDAAGRQSCEGLSGKQRASEGYWHAFETSQQAFASYFRAGIDFDQFAGLPQVVGGIYPPREFPNVISHRAELLLASPSTPTFHVDLTNPGPAAVGLTVTLRQNGRTEVHPLTFPAGRTDAPIDISDLLPSTSLLEVSLACDPSACGTARLHFIGSR